MHVLLRASISGARALPIAIKNIEDNKVITVFMRASSRTTRRPVLIFSHRPFIFHLDFIAIGLLC
jgi:hypothetical protein